MKQRSITSVFIVATTLLAVLAKLLPHQIGDYIFDIFALVIAFVASFEMANIHGRMGHRVNTYLATFYTIFHYVIFLIAFKKVSIYNVMFIEFACLVVYFVMILILELISERSIGFKSILKTSWDTFRACIYPGFILCLILTINHLDAYINITHVSLVFIIMIFAITMLTDTMAYIVGCSLRGPKLAPKISPNKTISGAVGGLLGGIGGAMLVYMAVRLIPAWSGVLAVFNLSWWKFLLIGLFGSIIGQAGDLMESKFKRMADVKDSGNIFPGHGGMLDRVDAMTAVTLLIYIVVIIIV